MSEGVRVKICGVTESADIPAALLAGASYLGFVFYPPSPRNLDIHDAAFMASSVPEGVTRVALTVDADDAMLGRLIARVPIDMLQLHGRETPRRVAAIRSRFGLPVMKAVGVANAKDLERVDAYADVADQILVDAKPATDAALPGGNGLSFDWRLLAGREWTGPWMLAGGLTPANVAEAIRLTGATQVDVSSGVESSPGIKDAQAIAEFVLAAQA